MTDDTDDLPVDPPVIVGDELVIGCEHGSCERTTRVSTEIDPVEAEVSEDDWKIRFVPDGSSLTVDGAECPRHRTDKAIDELARTQSEMGAMLHRRTEHAMNRVDIEQ